MVPHHLPLKIPPHSLPIPPTIFLELVNPEKLRSQYSIPTIRKSFLSLPTTMSRMLLAGVLLVHLLLSW
jgi:hypothetical protein